MARYRDAKCRLCRREGTKLFLKGDRCFSNKCAIEKRDYPPGQKDEYFIEIEKYFGKGYVEKLKANDGWK